MCCSQHLLRGTGPWRIILRQALPAYARRRHRTRMWFGVVVVIHGARRLQLHRRHTCSMACEDLEPRCLVLDINGWESLGHGGTR